MKADIDLALTVADLADTRDKAARRRARFAGRQSVTKLEVDPGALETIPTVIDTKSVPGKPVAPFTATDEVPRMFRPSVIRKGVAFAETSATLTG